MTATNHVLTGALIAASLPEPIIAVPLAFTSHFLLDALPHYGRSKIALTDKRFFMILSTDIWVASTILILLFTAKPLHWQLMIVCAIVSASPDLLWLPYWIRHLRGKVYKKSFVVVVLGRIQWAERPWGWTIELLFFGIMSFYLFQFL